MEAVQNTDVMNVKTASPLIDSAIVKRLSDSGVRDTLIVKRSQKRHQITELLPCCRNI